MNAERLEAEAKEARRRADVAKHKPLSLETLDAYGEEEMRHSGKSQINLLELACQLQNAYGTELSTLWSVIRMLRSEALYWRQRCQETEAKLEAADARNAGR